MEILEVSSAVLQSRAGWQYRGQQRPTFAQAPAAGQESVWDFPRPPIIQPVSQSVRVSLGDQLIGETDNAVPVLETAGAPTYYLPPADVDQNCLTNQGEQSLCEWKGVATVYAVAGIDGAAWAYHRVFAEFASLAGWLAFYPTQLACFVGDEQVTPQPGGYYGGWVTRALVGPIKGEPGSSGW